MVLFLEKSASILLVCGYAYAQQPAPTINVIPQKIYSHALELGLHDYHDAMLWGELAQLYAIEIAAVPKFGRSPWIRIPEVRILEDDCCQCLRFCAEHIDAMVKEIEGGVADVEHAAAWVVRRRHLIWCLRAESLIWEAIWFKPMPLIAAPYVDVLRYLMWMC